MPLKNADKDLIEFAPVVACKDSIEFAPVVACKELRKARGNNKEREFNIFFVNI
jgi:hypothetical protein